MKLELSLVVLLAACGSTPTMLRGRSDSGEAAMTTERVTFASSGTQLVGTLHLPSPPPSGRSAAVVVTGSWTTVKEQMPTQYARRLAKAGFAALVFDFRGFGESAGEPRDVESPERKAGDIGAAVAYLRTRPDLDADRLGVVAICASAGYAAVAASRDPAIRSLVLVAPWLHDASIVEAFYGGPEGVARRRAIAREARVRWERTREVTYVKAASNTDATAAMHFEGDVLDYYLNPRRGGIPEWSNRFALMAWEEWLDYDPIPVSARVKAPVLVVTGPGTATPQGAARFVGQLAGPNEVVSLEGTQFHFYDDEVTVARASAAAAQHLRRTLSAERNAPGTEAEAVRRVVMQLFHAVDGRDWGSAVPLLADEVVTDYTSLFGGAVQRQPGPGLVEAWRGLLSPLQATQHLLGPIDVVANEASATVECHVRAYHVGSGVNGGDEWMVAGHYVMSLASRGGSWRVASITLRAYYQTGNRALLEEVGAAARSRNEGSGEP